MEIEGLLVRQCVVKIPSLQRLREPDDTTEGEGKGEVKAGKVLKEMETVEYLVMQKKIINGKEGEWVLWGTTQPSKWGVRNLRGGRQAGDLR
jgi:hypothetical protein